MPIARIPFSIPALNEINTSTDSNNKIAGGFRFNGQPNVKFSVPAQPRLLDTSEMYLTGQVVMMNSSNDAVSAPTANWSDNNGANLTSQTNLNISPWAGVENAIERVMVQTKKSSVELMTHNNYPMYVNLKKAYHNNERDYLNSPLTRSLASGINNGLTNRHGVVAPNATHNTAGVMSNITNFNDINFGQFFSFKIDTSLLNNQKPLHLGDDHLGGLLITLELANPDGFFNQRFRSMDFTQQTVADIKGSYYVLKNLRLEGRYEVPSAQELASYTAPVGLNERINLLNDVNSSVNSNTYTPNLGAVKAFVNLFVDEDQTNNIAQNQSNFRTPLGISSYTQDKNSVRAPEDFVVNVKPNFMETTADNSNVASPNPLNLAKPITGQGDAELRERFQRALLDGKLADHSSATLELSNLVMVQDNDATGAGTDGVGDITDCDVLGVGLDYTNGIGNSSNFKNQDYTLILKSGVNSGNTQLAASRRSKTELQQTYIRNGAVLDTSSLVKSQ
jgi:hypothetical protein